MMTTKSQRRVNYEERVEQDGRLTGKHIRTLMHLQDLHSENELLKAKIAELELNQAKAARCDLLDREVHKLRGDLSKCQELHEIAKDAKEKIQQTQRECLMKIDDNCAELSEKHRVEIMRVVSEKLEAENSWLLEREQLVYQNQDCCRENRDLKEQLELLRRTLNKAEKTSSVLQESRATVESLQERCEQLQSERSSLQKSIQRVSMENDTLRSQVEMLNSRVAVLEMQSKQAQEAKVEQHDLVEQIEKFKTCIQQLEDKNGILVEENLKLDKDNKTLEFNLQDSAQALKHVFKERDLLKNRISGLLNEIAALKSQTPERHAFADFVHLKRDFNALREEHDKLLRRRSSKTNVLPTLKAETSAVSRIQSGGSVRTGTGGV